MMRKYIPYLLSSCVILSAQSYAIAGNVSIETEITAAASHNTANVRNNFANAGGINIPGEWHHIGSSITEKSFNGSEGVSLESQNSGANSVVQNAVSLAYVGSCVTCLRSGPDGTVLTASEAVNTGAVKRNLDYPGYGTADPAGPPPTPPGGGGGGTSPGGQGLTPQGSDPFATIANSFDNSVGVFSAVQNAGNNSVLQSAISVGVLKVEVHNSEMLVGSASKNNGSSQGDVSYSLDTPTSSNITNSTNSSSGIFETLQNSGSNSMIQNSTSIAYLDIRSESKSSMANEVAASNNSYSAKGNFANSQLQNNSSILNYSFNGSEGVLASLQNAGANSVVESAISVVGLSY